MKNEAISVSDFNALVNQTLAFAYPEVVIEGEVSSFKLNHNKWVFFDLKDNDNVINCFMMVFQLRTAIEDGMLIRVRATPKLTSWGKFSLTIHEIELAGEGSVKRAFEMLKAKFEKEGLFDLSRKRQLTRFPQRIALITSKQAAAFNDFVTVLEDRFGGIKIDHMQVKVQGESAPQEITEAITYFENSEKDYDAMVIIRGGGSAEDLQAFNDEGLVRAIYASSIPTLVGIGHEDDVTLAELVADVRAATPTDAARRLAPDRRELSTELSAYQIAMTAAVEAIIAKDYDLLNRYQHALHSRLIEIKHSLENYTVRINSQISLLFERSKTRLDSQTKLLASLDPQAILARGYSIARVNGRVLRNAGDYNDDDQLVLQLSKGSLRLKKIK